MTVIAGITAETDLVYRNRDQTRQGVRLFEVEAVVTHNPVLRCDEVLDKLYFVVAAVVRFRDGARPGVRAEDGVEADGLSFDLVHLTVVDFIQVLVTRDQLPFAVHVE